MGRKRRRLDVSTKPQPGLGGRGNRCSRTGFRAIGRVHDVGQSMRLFGSNP